jgi:hypothetical protein
MSVGRVVWCAGCGVLSAWDPQKCNTLLTREGERCYPESVSGVGSMAAPYPFREQAAWLAARLLSPKPTPSLEIPIILSCSIHTRAS